MAHSTKRKDGRLTKSIMIDGERKWFYGKTEKEINRKILEYQAKKEDSTLFSNVASEWWDEAEPELAEQTKRGYKRALELAIDFFGKTKIKEIKPSNVISYLQEQARLGYAKKTVANRKLVLSLIFTYAINHDMIEYNPAISVRLPKGLPQKTIEPATPEEEQTIMNAEEMWLFPFIAIYTGMRKGEILALQLKDIDFENNIIKVSKSVGHDGNKPFIKSPKTEKGNRIFPLLEPLKERLLPLRKTLKPTSFIISADEGKTPLTEKRYITLYNKFKKEAGVSCNAHQLRHSFATIAIEQGIDAKIVQEILGHKQVSTTLNTYTMFRLKLLTKAKDQLDIAFKKEK